MYQLIRFKDASGRLKARAKAAAKADGIKLYEWIAQAIREKLGRGK